MSAENKSIFIWKKKKLKKKKVNLKYQYINFCSRSPFWSLSAILTFSSPIGKKFRVQVLIQNPVKLVQQWLQMGLKFVRGKKKTESGSGRAVRWLKYKLRKYRGAINSTEACKSISSQENDLIGFLDYYDPKKILPNTFCSPKVWQSFELHPNKSWSMRNEN